MTDKGLLAENLRRYDRAQSRPGLGMDDLVPETYCLGLPDDRKRFFEQLPPADSRENIWILKPCNSSEGKGIRIMWQFDELRAMDFGPKAERFVIQRYIANPFLLEGTAPEIRIYWLVASLDPLLVLMYPVGTVRLTSKPFVLDDFSNTLVHVTNIVQQKSHPEYDSSVVLKWSFSDWEKYLVEDLKLAPKNYVEDHLKPQLKRMLAFVCDAVAPAIVRRPANGLFFSLFGADIIFDDRLHPWLTEVQRSPGLSFDDPVKRELIPAVLNEAVAIVLEVQRRKREGTSLAHLEKAGTPSNG